VTEPLRALTGSLDLAAVRAWIAGRVGPAFGLELKKQRAWATTLRVSVGEEVAWFKACEPVQAFEPRLTTELARRWPDRLPHVLGVDETRAWLLTADAGASVGTLGNAPEIWLRALPRYAELQRGEADHVAGHLAHHVPDLRLETLPARYELMLAADLPIDGSELGRLKSFGLRLRGLVHELETAGIGESIQHDDLHLNSLYARGEELRILDWGDASIGQPFFSLVTTFWFLETVNGLPPSDPWFDRLRSAYLEPWGGGPAHAEALRLAERVGLVAHAIAWLRHRDAMPALDRHAFDVHYAELLKRVLTRAID
jgi:hypothetical protein